MAGELGGVAQQVAVQLGEALLRGENANGVFQPGQRGGGQRLRGGGVLDEFGHDERRVSRISMRAGGHAGRAAQPLGRGTQDVGQAHPGQLALAAHEPVAGGGHGVGDDHRALEQGRFQRGGAAGHQRHIARGQGLVRLAGQHVHGFAQPAGGGQRAHALQQVRHGGHEKARAGARLPNERGGAEKARGQVRDFGAAAAGQQGNDGRAF